MSSLLHCTRILFTVPLCIALSSVTSCERPGDEESEPTFALTSADVVHPDDGSFSANLVFLAPRDDPIWTDVTGIGVAEGISFGPGDFEVVTGEGNQGDLLGNIILNLDASKKPLSFETIDLFYADTSEPVTVDVGAWSIRSQPAESFAAVDVDAEVVAVSGCSSTAELPVPASVTVLRGISSGSAEVEFDDVALDESAHTVSVTFTCADTVDFHITSPTLEVTDAGGLERSLQLGPLSIGYLDIDDEDLERIRSR